jgi:hypothetical protein
MAKLHNRWLECDGECGTKIDITSRRQEDVRDGTLNAVAEMLGWMTVDRPNRKKKGDDPDPLIFCGFCQERADVIVKGK